MVEEGGVSGRVPSRLPDKLVRSPTETFTPMLSSSASASISSRSTTSATIDAMKSSCSSCSASPTPFVSGVETSECLRELGVENDGVSREVELSRDLEEEGVASEVDRDLDADEREERLSEFFLFFSMSFFTQSLVKFLTFDCFSAES